MKRLIAIVMIFALLVPISPAVAADEMSAPPTVEEILNEYHRKAFEAWTQGESETASTWSRRGDNEKTLEQETVDTLTAAGYEAYNVTADNYETLENELNTDFASMGLDPEGSYIVVLGGEDPAATEGASTYNVSPNPEIIGPPDGGSSYFTHTYNGETYYMRRITVTADQNTALNQTTPVNLLEKYGLVDLWNDLNVPITVISFLPQAAVVGTIYSLVSLMVPDIQYTDPTLLMFIGATNWTPTYIQVYDSEDSEWQWRAVYEYATAGYFINETHYDSYLNRNVNNSDGGTFQLIYSTNYYNQELLFDYAAMYHAAKGYWRDTVETVEYAFDGEVVITHTRWREPLPYEPSD